MQNKDKLIENRMTAMGMVGSGGIEKKGKGIYGHGQQGDDYRGMEGIVD